MVLIVCGLCVILAALFFQFGRLTRQTIVTKTRAVKVSIAQQFGKPSQVIEGSTLNAQLAGLTCDWYAPKATLVCHRP